MSRKTVSASQKREIILPDIKKFKSSDNKKIEIDIQESSACPRYAGCIIDNIKINESPSEIKDLLISIGINPINNVVDITNYVLHSLGQPLHAFDFEKISKYKVKKISSDAGVEFQAGVSAFLKSRKMVNGVPGINRVVYDITSEPPSTIELE